VVGRQKGETPVVARTGREKKKKWDTAVVPKKALQSIHLKKGEVAGKRLQQKNIK